MPWVKFTRNYDYRPLKRVMIPYKQGQIKFVKRECANEAKAKGAAVDAERPVQHVTK